MPDYLGNDSHNTARSLHDLGMAAWFGGTLMGAVGLNGAVKSISRPNERLAASHRGWTRWIPVQLAAIGSYLAGAVVLLVTDRHRVAHQSGVGQSSAIKTGFTVAALATTAYSGVLNRQLAAHLDSPVEGATEPSADTPEVVAKAQRQLKIVQWAIPALVGGIVVTSAIQGEQQRGARVLRGLLAR